MDSSGSKHAPGTSSQAPRTTNRPVSIPPPTQSPSRNEQTDIPTTSPPRRIRQLPNFSRPLSNGAAKQPVSRLPSNVTTTRRSRSPSIPGSFFDQLLSEGDGTAAQVTSSPSGYSKRSSIEANSPRQPQRTRDSGVLSERQGLELIPVISNKSTVGGSGQGSVKKPPKAGFF